MLIASATEESVYQALDLPLIPPPLRENSGEIQAAANGRLPDLVTLERIKGDLHFHSDRSGDGRSTLEEMVAAAAANVATSTSPSPSTAKTWRSTVRPGRR